MLIAVRITLAGILLAVAAALTPAGGSAQLQPIDRIVIRKAQQTMTLPHGDTVAKTYKVALSTVPIGAKD